MRPILGQHLWCNGWVHIYFSQWHIPTQKVLSYINLNSGMDLVLFPDDNTLNGWHQSNYGRQYNQAFSFSLSTDHDLHVILDWLVTLAH